MLAIITQSGLIGDHVDESFFSRERIRALIDVALYASAALTGGLVAPLLTVCGPSLERGCFWAL